MKLNTKRNIIIFSLVGFAVTSILGALFHFLYDWTHCPFIALFSAVNESTWEHMKIFFFPTFFFAVVQYFLGAKKTPAFWCVKLYSTALGLLLIPILFYTLRGIFGNTPDWINIAIFFVTAAITYFYEATQFLKEKPCSYQIWTFVGLCIIALAFCLFTYLTPHIPLFQDPVNGNFGIS